MGTPEPLKHGFQGYWSRRITDEHRLVYKVVGGRRDPDRRVPLSLRTLTGARPALAEVGQPGSTSPPGRIPVSGRERRRLKAAPHGQTPAAGAAAGDASRAAWR
ncbi:hypothetical protein GCM10009790_25890 [Georgenia ruanii]